MNTRSVTSPSVFVFVYGGISDSQSVKVSEARTRGVSMGTRLGPPFIQTTWGMVFPIVL